MKSYRRHDEMCRIAILHVIANFLLQIAQLPLHFINMV